MLTAQDHSVEPLVFGEGGQIKMLYDRRQRPQSVYLDDKLHIVFNAGGEKSNKPKFKTVPMAITYDPATRSFSDIVTLGKPSSDHHYGPIIWADENGYLHVLSGCHKTPGTHLISKEPGSIGKSLADWNSLPPIAPKISYPCVFNIYGGKELIYYRTDGHTSSWTYRITDDNGKTWTGPADDVTDMDCKGKLDWSSYQTKLLSEDGQFLHVAFIAYDDVKNPDPERSDGVRFHNPRYNEPVSNEWKYNLYYVKIDLQTHEVTNADRQPLKTPIDIDYANANCRIWDTDWRGAGVPPAIVLNQHAPDNPGFLHVLSGENSKKDNAYYFFRRESGKWKPTLITGSSHQWNSCHLNVDDDGTLHAYVVVGDDYFDSERSIDRYGGGRIQEWVSSDGNEWKKSRDLTPDSSKYPGWKYNNIQPVRRPGGEIVDGMLLFYGWASSDPPDARAFLIDERHR